VEIELLTNNKGSYSWWLLLLIPIGLAGFFMTYGFGGKTAMEPGIDKKATDTENQASSENKLEPIQLGNYQFYPGNQVLAIGQKNIPLSQKETKALTIFAANIDQVVDRETLMKEIWEDEGVVVISRNVDVLVSKLRKKLSDDNAIQFVNVHGRGYKFVIG
jgi:DNA-binding response OmpR family regulator